MAQAKFRYRLQKILEIKIKAEDDEKEKLAKYTQMMEQVQERLASL